MGSGMGMGMNHWEWEGMGLKKTFPLTSIDSARSSSGIVVVAASS